MSSGEVRRVSRQDIQLVQNLIERCLQLYMNQKEVMETLLYQEKIEPRFTELVWQKLEEENQEFFKAYRVRLMLKHQIILFNNLLEKQAALMGHTASPRPENFCRPLSPSIVVNGTRPSLYQNMQPVPHASTHERKIDISSHSVSYQNMHMELLPGMNGMTIKSEPEFSNHSDFPFCADGDFLETHPVTEDTSLASLSSTNAHPLGEPLPDNDSTQFSFYNACNSRRAIKIHCNLTSGFFSSTVCLKLLQ
ncbi:hypothetical protein QJS10_CPB14g01641 [Acorus calamus]|uniref:Angiotensin-converting enzyme 2 n=1 Tax=Acorus calamus TaxID=4465 RepID=A0AAV9DCR9_ACOCL|nr:hypothetical protein QJS10_CPB14g01641 [Acorus calamus]